MKRLVEQAIATATRLPFVSSRMSGRTLILAYHNVTPPGCPSVGERSAHIPWETFVDHLDVIERVAQVMPLASLFESRPLESDRPHVVLTFDDAYAGAVGYGIPEIVRRGMPVTIFVSPGLLNGGVFWWDALADARTGVLDSALRRHVLEELSGSTTDALAWAQATGVAVGTVAAYATGCSTEALESCAKLPGVALAGHSWSHRNLLRLEAQAIRDELEQFAQWARALAMPTIPAFAFPYGHYNDQVDAVTRQAGYSMTLRVDGGWCDATPDVSQPLPRLNVPAGLSAPGLEFRLRGIRP